MMKKGSLSKMLFNCFCSSSSSTSCFICINGGDTHEEEGEMERISLVKRDDRAVRIKDVLSSSANINNNNNQTLGFQLKPKMVMLKVSIHCEGCAKRVEKHIKKMDGVTSYKIDVDTKLVAIVGDIFPLEVRDSVSKVIKYVEFWDPSDSEESIDI